LATYSDFSSYPPKSSRVSSASAYPESQFPKLLSQCQFSWAGYHRKVLGFSFRPFLSKLVFTGHQASGYCLGLGSAERVGGLYWGYWASVCFVYRAQAISSVRVACYPLQVVLPFSNFGLLLLSPFLAGGAGHFAGCSVAQAISEVPLVPDLWGVGCQPYFVFKLTFICALGISGSGGHFAGCPIAQAVSRVTLSFVQRLFGSFFPFQMSLMAEVAPGILRVPEEESRSSVTYSPNKSFQGTQLRSAPELSRSSRFYRPIEYINRSKYKRFRC
jgi:hypothetical protein